uniref:aldehyde dehydrogenase family protein n=1 Tax=uncultured Eudoraea sp. TaxID=1035614 RepID=UPI00263805E5
KISFTGSTKVGKLLMKQCADTVKKVSLELGGNAPFIVFKNANIDEAVSAAMTAKYRNAGQTCICANRFYIHEDVYEEFLEKYTKEVKKLTVGSGMNEGVSIGPLINEKSKQKVDRLVSDAIKRGGQVFHGGNYIGETAYEPTIITELSIDLQIHDEEIFAPISAIYKFKNEEEVIEMANNTPYGLASYFFSQDYKQIWRVSEALEYGMVGINTGIISSTVAPFGGVKESGIGREGSKYGIEEFQEMKYMCWSLKE